MTYFGTHSFNVWVIVETTITIGMIVRVVRRIFSLTNHGALLPLFSGQHLKALLSSAFVSGTFSA